VCTSCAVLAFLPLHSGADLIGSDVRNLGGAPAFPDQLLPDMAYEENATGGRLTETPSVVAVFTTLLD
jgi:hypothetical protein